MRPGCERVGRPSRPGDRGTPVRLSCQALAVRRRVLRRECAEFRGRGRRSVQTALGVNGSGGGDSDWQIWVFPSQAANRSSIGTTETREAKGLGRECLSGGRFPAAFSPRRSPPVLGGGSPPRAPFPIPGTIPAFCLKRPCPFEWAGVTRFCCKTCHRSSRGRAYSQPGAFTRAGRR